MRFSVLFVSILLGMPLSCCGEKATSLNTEPIQASAATIRADGLMCPKCANNVTLHTTKAHATAGSNIVDLARTNVSTSVTGITTASGSANFTKTAHGLVVGDKVTVTKNAPTGLTLSQTYNVATVASANVFTLTGITDAGSASSTVEVSVDAKGGGSGTNTSNVITMTGHGFESGDQVRSGTTGGGLALNTAYY